MSSPSTEDVTVSDGVVSARYPLVNKDGSDAGEVVLEAWQNRWSPGSRVEPAD